MGGGGGGVRRLRTAETAAASDKLLKASELGDGRAGSRVGEDSQTFDLMRPAGEGETATRRSRMRISRKIKILLIDFLNLIPLNQHTESPLF